MKTQIQFLFGLLFTVSASAEFRTWTRTDGKTAELDLISVRSEGGEKSGEFKMKSGQSVTLKASSLSTADAKLLDERKPAPISQAAVTSAFDETLEGDLLKLEGKSLKKFEMTEPPKKFYVFYYTASWCGPCQQFTPSLVKFYETNKNENFELVLISHDEEQGDMEEYAVGKKMPWPQLKLSKVKGFEKKFNHGVRGIPTVVVCKVDGTRIPGDFRDLAALQKLVK